MRCKGVTVASYNLGKRCAFHAVRDGYCKRHHPDERVRECLKAVDTARRRLEAAELALHDAEAASARLDIEPRQGVRSPP
jgi:hypothetical protein